MRSRLSCKLTAIHLAVVCAIVGLAAVGCSRNTPTGPTPTGSLAARGFSDAAGLSSSGSTSASPRRLSSVSVEWECFAAGSGCHTTRTSPLGVSTGEIVTAAPTALTSSVQGTTVVLGWGVPPGNQPTSYVIEAGSAAGASNITVFDTGNAATGLTVTNVPPGTYFVRVRGRDTGGPGPASNEVSVVVGAEPPLGPCQPHNLTATVIGANVALSWSSPTAGSNQCGFNAYLVQVGSAPGGSDLAQVATPGLINSYTVSGVSNGTFYVRVRSQGPGALSAPSNEVVVSVTGVVPPGTTTWTGLVADGEGSTAPDDDCGTVRSDVSLAIVQSGTNINGIVRITVRSVASSACQALVGFVVGEPFSGTVIGQFPDGAGSLAITTRTGAVTATFASGRITGSIQDRSDSAPGTVILRRQ